MNPSYESFFLEQLDKIEKQQLTRHLRRFDGPNQCETLIEGRKNILLSSNHYLGLGTDEDAKRKANEAINQFGIGSGGSRLTTGNSSLHEQLEEAIARFKGNERTLLFSSGYLANVGVISSVVGKGDVIFSDEYNHASIIDGCRLSRAKTVIYSHCNMESLERALKEEQTSGKKLIVTDGVFSMDGDIAPLPEIKSLARQYEAMVMVDDAHGTGVLGKLGKGTAEHFGIEDVDITVGTMSKALGTEGGFVTGSSHLIEYLKNRARTFIFQTALSPGVIGATLAVIEKLMKQPEIVHKLQWNAAYLRNSLTKKGFNVLEGETAIIPLIIGGAKETLQFSARLEERGVFAPGIRPPTVPEGTSRIRITVMATHSKEQLDQAIDIFTDVGKELGII